MSDANEMTNQEQMAAWRQELDQAIDDKQWQRAIQLCSWLRYALWQQESSDPEVDEALHLAKERLAKKKLQHEKHKQHQKEDRQRRDVILQGIAASQPKEAFDSIEEFYKEGANGQEVIQLLDALKTRFSRMLGSRYRDKNWQAAAFGRRIDELEERARSNRAS